jgi:hypothetical protein
MPSHMHVQWTITLLHEQMHVHPANYSAGFHPVLTDLYNRCSAPSATRGTL